MGLHYDGLPAYNSYQLAWLGPIIYPLTLALLAQAYVVRDMVRAWRGKAELSTIAKRLTRLNVAPEPDERVTLIVCFVLLSEIVFAVACIVQCIVNFASRSFVGSDTACDIQAFYATYYTISSVGLFALAMVFGARILLTSGGCPLFCKPIIIAAGVAVHGAALIIAALPLMGVGDYLFATDYCQYNVEGPVFAPLVFVWLIGALLITVASAAGVILAPQACAAPLPFCGAAAGAAASKPRESSPRLRRAAVRLFGTSAVYCVAAWLTTLVIIGLYWSDGHVFDSPHWRVYGAQAIILHSNQLVVPLLIGVWWRRLRVTPSWSARRLRGHPRLWASLHPRAVEVWKEVHVGVRRDGGWGWGALCCDGHVDACSHLLPSRRHLMNAAVTSGDAETVGVGDADSAA